MNANSENELYEIGRELHKIYSELNNIAYSLEREFKGIGSERCAYSLTNMANQTANLKRRLENMDLTTIKEGFVPPAESNV